MTPEEIAELRARRYNAHRRVPATRSTRDLMIMRVQPDFPLPPHQPGQYSTLGLGYWEPRVAGCQAETLKPDESPKLVRRAYSISCSV